MLQATLEANNSILLIVLLVSSLLNMFYLVSVPLRAFFARPVDQAYTHGVREAPMFSLVAIMITMTGCFLLFVMVNPAWRLAEGIVQ